MHKLTNRVYIIRLIPIFPTIPLKVHDEDQAKVEEGIEHGEIDTKEQIHMIEDAGKR
jgi:hypothetical protein